MKVKGILQQELIGLLNGTVLTKRKAKKYGDTLHIEDGSLIEAAYKLAENNPDKLLIKAEQGTFRSVLLTKIGA